MAWTGESDFYRNLITYMHRDELFGSDLVIVRRFQNETKPVDVYGGESMIDLHIGSVAKSGTDYFLGWDQDGDVFRQWFRGDRIVQVDMEYFGPDALTQLTRFRDLNSHPYMSEVQAFSGFSEIRDDENEPYSTTRVHSDDKYIESAEYNTRFAVHVDYFVGVGLVESLEISSKVTGSIVDHSGSIIVSKP